MSAHHRFAPPWSVEEQDGCFVIRDRNGQALSCVYFKNEHGLATERTSQVVHPPRRRRQPMMCFEYNTGFTSPSRNLSANLIPMGLGQLAPRVETAIPRRSLRARVRMV